MVRFHINNSFFLGRSIYEGDKFIGAIQAVAYDESIDALVYFCTKFEDGKTFIAKYDSRTTSVSPHPA